MAPPDHAFLDRLREQSAEAYQESFARQQTIPVVRRGALFLVGMAAAVAATFLAGLFLYRQEIKPTLEGATFAQVLKATAGAETLHAKVIRWGPWTTRPNETDDVWVRHDRLRIDHQDGTYEIADPHRAWLVDEKDNRATPEKSLSFQQAAAVGVSLLGLMEMPFDKGHALFDDQLPAGRVNEKGAEYLVYHLALPEGKGPREITALVDPHTLRLHSARLFASGSAPDAELTVVAYGEPVDEQKFVVKDTLTEDGRVGKVADVQGVVSIRPVQHQRWTPVGDGTLLRPGDWVRTDVRGANAVLLRLVKQTTLTLGPGSLVEVVSPTRIRVHQGEVEANVPKGDALDLVTLGGQSIAVKGRLLYRVEENRIVRLEREPLWLKGFKGTVSQESLGSLLAKVDGRDVPLTVGYHKVTVDIRDQIARTTIEESFVNHTDSVLEGVFHFPLPADASISGFGMWIGDNLVEADVVEKQRAREIYETILTEKRDPGLLEWTAGNVFKARVYPISPHSEKRIKIAYTQVLPLRDGRYRYSYALQSDLLRQHPLRQLDIDVKVQSALPLRSVTSPTHTTRNELTEHAAHIEFSAQEYVPTRDFEVVVEVDEQKQPAVVLVPHRRGDDGYFLLQILPRLMDSPARPLRSLVPNGPPLRLLVLADTSASMDAGQRAQQAEFVAALLGSLTSQDTVNLGCCDVACDWAFDRPQPAGPRQILAARQFLAARASLGWTDLDRAFASAFRQAEPGTQIVYIGDGIVTTGDGDPAAFAQRLRRLYQEQGHEAACHAVAVGSTFEQGVLAAVGSLGGGSLRGVSGDQAPVAAARELLHEMTQPGLRDLKVEFKGIRTARVYPEELPNLPSGSQQIILGRYLPEGRDQAGEVIVTGRVGNRPVRYSTRVSLKDAEEGNSFIPRLWARMHLDRLLAQGNSAAVRDEIIALSQEYQIITPYTSLLVLESDADRERFGVKRTFRMRNGERFFAKGRVDANYELARQQILRAGDWRLGLRRLVLGQFARLGRNPEMFQPPRRRVLDAAGDFTYFPMMMTGVIEVEDRVSITSRGDRFGKQLDMDFVDKEGRLAGKEEGKDVRGFSWDRPESSTSSTPADAPPDTPAAEPADSRGVENQGEGLDKKQANQVDWTDEVPDRGIDVYGLLPVGKKALWELVARDDALELSKTPYDLGFLLQGGRGVRGPYGYLGPHAYADPRPAFDTLFPALPPLPRKSSGAPPSWSTAARDLARSLLRTETLTHRTGGVEILRTTEFFNPYHNRLTQRSRRRELFAPGAWLTRAEDDRSAPLVQWCDGRERGVFSQAFPLGRLRTATAAEGQTPPLDLDDFSLAPLDETYRGYSATVERQGRDRATLVLRQLAAPGADTRIVIDTGRHVVLSFEQWRRGKAILSKRFGDFVEAGGCWWAGRIETLDEAGRRTMLITQTVKEHGADQVRRQIRQELTGREQVLFLHEPLPRVVEAKRAQQAGKAGFEDHLALLRHFAAAQQWTQAREHLEKAEALAAGKPGLRWLRDAFLSVSRRNEELKKRLLAEADQLARSAGDVTTFARAEHVVGHASAALSADEMLLLLERLRPVYEKRPARVQALERWGQLRLTYLQQLGRTDEALRLQKQLALDYPEDAQRQQAYAQALASSGDFPAAYDWIKHVLTPRANWSPEEEETLRGRYAALLEQQGRYRDLAAYLADWVKRDPATGSAYARYLSALVYSGQDDQANDLIARWLREGQVEGDLPPAVATRLEAAVNQALGRGYNLYTNRIEDRWLVPLRDTALFCARRPVDLSVAESIMQSTFAQTDEARNVRKEVLRFLTTDLEKLTPPQIQSFVQWVQADAPVVPAATWKQIRDGLHRRWSAEKQAEARHLLGHVLAGILENRATPAEPIAFLHEQLREGPSAYRVGYARKLLDTLLAPPWSAENEDEALGLLGRLADGDDPSARLYLEVAALYRLTDRMVEGRFTALMNRIPHQEKLTRTELRAKQDENRKAARSGYTDRLRRELGKHGKDLDPWLAAERLYLELRLGRDPKVIATECWAYLGDRPPNGSDIADEGQPPYRALLDGILRQRFLTTLADLASRKGADPALVERLLKYVERGVAADTQDGSWKRFKYQLLVALDRPKDLEAALRQWVKADDPDGRWRVALAYLLAEQGRLADAVALLEEARKLDALSPAAYRTLADWSLALNRRERHDRALVDAYKAADEWRLSRLIYAHVASWQRSDGHAPSELDPEVLLMFRALFEKSSSPGSYLGQLEQLYQATRDFRLLAVLPDAAIGQSAGKVYPFLQGMQGIITDIHDEATVDELAAHLDEVRRRARTPVDRRALDLLEVQVRRRAAELKNQPGPHVQAALAALQRSFKHEWSEGEPVLLADLLAGLGVIPQQPLVAEQLRQLKALEDQARPGSAERLHIAQRYATTLSGYGRPNDAIDLLQAALKERQDANDGVLPVSANEALTTLVSLFERIGHDESAEKLLLAQLRRPAHRQQAFWLTQQLYQLYNQALQSGGTVSLGTGPTLYVSVEHSLRDALGTDDQGHRRALVSLLCQVYRTAAGKKLAGARDDLRAFAFQRLADVLRRQTSDYDGMVGDVAQTVHDLLGPGEAVAFLLDRAVSEPAWLRYNNQDAWSRHSWTLAQWREEAKTLPAGVDARLLKFVLAELRRDLETRQARNRAFYDRRYGWYWSAKEADFVKAAEEVLARHRLSGASAEYVAEYLARGTGKVDRAIEVLQAAERHKLLGESGQAQLVTYLHEANRHAESIPLLVALVERRPDNLEYRVLLLRAYARTDRRVELLAHLKRTDAFFHEKGRWTESVLAALAGGTLDAGLHEQAVSYYKEVIGLHERTAPRRGIGDGVLSGYDTGLARAYAGLGKTAEAVDAAGSAVVCWGPHQRQRAEALNTLRQVLRDSPDLDAFVAHLDRQAAETGLQSPLVRKLVGQVYSEKGKRREAVVQLRLAEELQPNDAETHRLLVAELDALRDTEGAVRQLLTEAQVLRRDLKVYQELGRRLEALNRPREAERAYTSVVEVVPTESEGHALLAEIRQQHNRWDEAIGQWEQVARIRALEPTGLLGLAAAQVHERQWDQAEQTVRRLRGRAWPARFGNVEEEVRNLEQRITAGRAK